MILAREGFSVMLNSNLSGDDACQAGAAKANKILGSLKI